MPLCRLARKNYNGVATRRCKNFDVFIRFDRMYERDRRTDAHTLHDGIGRAYA